MSISFSSGADIFVEDTDTSYSLWGATPSVLDSSTILTLELTAYLTNYEDETTKTTTFNVGVTNTCADVTLTAGDIYEFDFVTTEILYENGGDDVELEYDAFTSTNDNCPIVYTVHLMSTGVSPTELTWNRESTSATAPSGGSYPDIADTVFSSNAKSSEYLSITRPESGAKGTVTISNTGDLDTYVGSYTLEVRGQH